MLLKSRHIPVLIALVAGGFGHRHAEGATMLPGELRLDTDGSTWAYVGAWQVDEGPNWQTLPPAYSGQEAAAFLFGGDAEDYGISTRPDIVTHTAFGSALGIYDGSERAESYALEHNGTGLYYDGTGYTQAEGQAWSAFVWDNAQGDEYTNYAFRLTALGIPEPATLFYTGIAVAIGLSRRRR